MFEITIYYILPLVIISALALVYAFLQVLKESNNSISTDVKDKGQLVLFHSKKKRKKTCCKICGGTGIVQGVASGICHKCQGTGYIYMTLKHESTRQEKASYSVSGSRGRRKIAEGKFEVYKTSTNYGCWIVIIITLIIYLILNYCYRH